MIKISLKAAERIIQWRRHFHQYPELGLKEYGTQKYLVQTLKKLQIPSFQDFGETGLLALIDGTLPGPLIAFRSDMDALPITELNDHPYCSRNSGLMHACGHDGHMAMLLGFLTWIKEEKKVFPGKIAAIFQPGEEGFFGAKKMLEAGLFQVANPDAIYGIHLWNFLPAGTLSCPDGFMMAAADEFFVNIKGFGGHAAHPHTAIDPIVCAARIVDTLQSIVSREISPFSRSVLTIGKICGGTAFNVIPDEVRFEGTLRADSEESRQLMKNRFQEIIESISRAHRCKSEINYIDGYPALINHPAEAQRVRKAAFGLFAEEKIYNDVVSMAGEDFAYFLQEKPGAFIFLGSAKDENAYPHHHPRFEIDESVLRLGVELMIKIAEKHWEKR
ncbi:MAG TPA: amidohydrolase [Candidatus Marinimicrobia bacterium]|nr:amidohydrolase [Candidatus Neomarinimicrobiota bacterium]